MQGASGKHSDSLQSGSGAKKSFSPFRKLIRNDDDTQSRHDKRCRILVVEDDSFVSMALEIALQKRNYHVAAIVTNGMEALEAVQTLHPDIVLMDIMIEGEKDGIQVAADIARVSDVPVIYLTASEEEQILDRAQSTHPFAFLLKPFIPTELYAAIEVALFRKHMEKKLRKSEARYATTLRSIDDAVISFDGMSEVNYINPSALRFTRRNEAACIGQPIHVLLKQMQQGNGRAFSFSSHIRKGLKGKKPDNPSGLYWSPGQGERIPVDISISFTEEKDGEVTGGVVIFRDISRIKEEEIRWANVVVGAQETDRRKIAENLHENLAQILSAVKFQFNSLENAVGSSGEKSLNQARKLLDLAMEECREISRNLSPKVLEDFGLAETLNEICQRLQRNHPDLKVELRADNYRGLRVYNREVTLFRIAQELIGNVMAHAEASYLRVTLTQLPNGKSVSLTVSDNGKGFDRCLFSSAGDNSGFKNIQNRIVLLGGKSYLRSAAGKGTTFLIEIPA